jgi:hypothetical protein
MRNEVKYYSEVIDHMKFYSNLNWKVFPVYGVNENGTCQCGNPKCDAVGKHPRIKNWQDEATSDFHKMSKWFVEWPDSNLGLVTGHKSFVALDVDTRHGGFENFDELKEEYGLLPDTAISHTGSGGLHYVFKSTNPIRNKQNVRSGIDFRGDGGYIVAPPSRHISGCQYCWDSDLHPSDVTICEIPRFLVHLLSPANTSDSSYQSCKWADFLSQKIVDGERNTSFCSLVGYLLRKYVDPYLVKQIVKIINTHYTLPPLSNQRLEELFNGICKRESQRRNKSKEYAI